MVTGSGLVVIIVVLCISLRTFLIGMNMEVRITICTIGY